jgi:hypothetical protein
VSNLKIYGDNNFGNIREGSGFAKYESPEAGLQALDKNLLSYADKGINTITGVINRWAPPSENDTSAYISDVSKRLGIKSDQPIDLHSPVVRQALATAITIHEHGPGILTKTAEPSAPITALPPGFSEAKSVLAKGGAERAVSDQNAAQDSPMRVNVLDNIVDLSKKY